MHIKVKLKIRNVVKSTFLIFAIYAFLIKITLFGQPLSISSEKPHLLMVGFPLNNSKASINLFNQYKLHELVGQGHFAEAQLFVGALQYVVVQAK